MNFLARSSRVTGPEDAGADRLVLLVDQHRRVAVEADGAAIGAAQGERRADDDGAVHFALLHLAARQGDLDRHDDDVADACILAARAAQHLDALDSSWRRNCRRPRDWFASESCDFCSQGPLRPSRRRPELPSSWSSTAGGTRGCFTILADLALEGVGFVVRVILLRACE